LIDVIAQLDDDSDDAVLARLATAISQLPADAAYEDGRAALRSALEQAREGVMALATLSDPDAFDPTVIDQLDERVAVLQQITRKHGGTLKRVLAALDVIRLERDRLVNASTSVATLDAQIVELEQREQTLAREARREREFAAVQLTNAVRVQLPRVALAGASLRFVVDGDDGRDAQILFTPNPGQPEGPLQSLASGGELSRVLLALSLETAHEDVVAVFDEVDAGVGGQVAQQIGDCLAELARRQQVLAVTHLASVAAKADHHFVVEKTVASGATSTTVRVLHGEQRVDEIARMLAGDEITDESRALARRLLETRS
jgi:DNA repair protein RecN (Recombination protein N)